MPQSDACHMNWSSLKSVYSKELWCQFRLWVVFSLVFFAEICQKIGIPNLCRLFQRFLSSCMNITSELGFVILTRLPGEAVIRLSRYVRSQIGGLAKVLFRCRTRRPASTGMFFAPIQILWSIFANRLKQNYCFDINFQSSYKHQFDHWFLYFMRKGITISPSKFFVPQKFRRGTLLCFRKILLSKNVRVERGGIKISSR